MAIRYYTYMYCIYGHRSYLKKILSHNRLPRIISCENLLETWQTFSTTFLANKRSFGQINKCQFRQKRTFSKKILQSNLLTFLKIAWFNLFGVLTIFGLLYSYIDIQLEKQFFTRYFSTLKVGLVLFQHCTRVENVGKALDQPLSKNHS